MTLTLEEPLRSVGRRQDPRARRLPAHVHQHQAAGALRGQGRDPAGCGAADGALRGGERARGARHGAAGVRGQHPAVPAGEQARRRAGDGPRRPRAVAQDHSARRAGAGSLDALRPRRHGPHEASIRAGCSSCKLSLAPADGIWDCPDASGDNERARTGPEAVKNQEDGDTYDPSNWDYFEDYYEGEASTGTSATIPATALTTATRQGIRASRNLLASNIGLIAKRGRQRQTTGRRDGAGLLAAAGGRARSTRSTTRTRCWPSASTDREGLVELDAEGPALRADRRRSTAARATCACASGGALPVSHFDVGGESVVEWPQGLSVRRPRRVAPGRLLST